MDKIKRYKILGKGGVAINGGTGQWSLPQDGKPGAWMPKIENIEPCVRGYHLCRVEDLVYWLNEEIYEAEGRGKFVRYENKDVFPEARLLRKLDTWDEKSGRLFAADCVEHVLHIFEKKYPNDNRPRAAIRAARDFAYRKITKSQLTAARDAARDAARAAAWDAARDAARAAAWDAARAAAWDAAWDAAGAAARAAERKWQSTKLREVLNI